MNNIEIFLDSIRRAIELILSGDPYVLSVTIVQLKVNLTAVMISILLAIPLSIILSFKEFKGKRLVLSILSTLMSLPPVVVGLIVFLILSKSGPLGFLNLLFTPEAMIIAQTILATPIITSMSVASIKSVSDSLKYVALTLGANKYQMILSILNEAKYGILVAILAGYGRVAAEVGAILIVGGNIVTYEGISYTRTLTTAITVEASMGRLDAAIAFGLILMLISFIINLTLFILQRRSV